MNWLQIPDSLLIIPVGVLGLLWGSFFNVCIVRIPEAKSLLGRSKCPRCGRAIRWYHNIPILSFLWLKGQCASCRKRISIQYPLVELSTALLFLWLFYQYGLTLRFMFYTVFTSVLLIISVIDLYHQIIPDELSLGGIVVGFLVSLILKDVSWWESLLGMGLGGGSFFAVSYLYEKLAKREGLGGGDVKLLAMIGAWLGYQSILVVVVASSFLGSVVGGGLMLMKKGNLKTAIPFGPFLAIGALIYLLWGASLQSLLFPWGWER